MRFRPEISISANDPLIILPFKGNRYENRLQIEEKMPTNYKLSLCRRIPSHLQHSSMALWPPRSIPSIHRVRHESSTRFCSAEQRPNSFATASDQAFRLRSWTELSNFMRSLSSMRIGEEVTTWSTLQPDLYKPTKKKPWQGIWVGDYSTHGCELLLVIQSNLIPHRKRVMVSSTESGLPAGFALENDADGEAQWYFLAEEINKNQSENLDDIDSRGDYTPSGSLEAIKLTGDINVPRGQPTWFADDISDSGLIKIADDDTFRGARIVRSVGHVAERGFTDDRYIPSQLILGDFNNLAQHWESFSHISCYKRVDIDALLAHNTSVSLRP